MISQASLNYERIARAIDFIREHFREQPGLEEIAEEVHLSPAHFQRMFTDWAGTSPKKFLQYISVGHAKSILEKDRQATLFDATFETGLSSTSRLHELFIKMEGMTPAEYRNGGAALSIHYSFAESPFGQLIIASTTKGICYMAFEDDQQKAIVGLQQKFPQAQIAEGMGLHQDNAIQFFQRDWTRLPEIRLHLRGTDFQLKVWESLLKIPMGRLSTYGSIAERIGNGRASRAVGTAIGDNPVAFLIPCHRVIRSSGVIGQYMWGTTRKTAIIGWENAIANNDLQG
ncbi:methylated-DNA--[protein]-cysteine S-methyltransferase [Nostoc ellipsosporum NOK]|nr:methylated-DNA--[protein]-cysteine S-methyltransferase [Nostoc ellipsosporum NOK]